MAAHGHRRQVLLFLVAIILPCMVLVILGLRMLAQEWELNEKRRADERRSLTGQLRQELSARLDRIARDETTALLADGGRRASRQQTNPSVVLVARLTGGQLTLPWEDDPRPTRFRRLLETGEFARLVSQGERTEIGAGQPAEAVDSYARALTAARDPAQAAYARLLRGRASLAAGRGNAARRDFETVLGSRLDIVDEHGVPLALYAASTLLGLEGQGGGVGACVHGLLEEPRWLSPTALYLLREVARNVRSSVDSTERETVDVLLEDVQQRLATTEQALSLQRDFPRLGLATGGPSVHNAGARWVAYGSPPWLVGTAAPVGTGGDILVAIRADSLFAAVENAVLEPDRAAADLSVATEGERDGELLGMAFPGIVVRFPASAVVDDGGWDMRRWFYLVVLFLVVSVTLFGAYLASRDVRRELRLAELRSRFVSAVSHELKTPLTAIRMFAETLQLGRPSSAETQAEYLETIVSESERLTRLLNNVLDFSRIERGKKEYRRKLDDLADIVRASARAMRYPLEQQQFALKVEIEEGLPPASVDRDAIEQAILNLLANAMKYSGDGREIGLRLRRADGRAVIEVEDHGVGIEPDEQRRIFEQFYRVPTCENDGIPGTGLGLTLVRHIAEGHDGRVTVDSAPGRGSTFAIHLPLGDGSV